MLFPINYIAHLATGRSEKDYMEMLEEVGISSVDLLNPLAKITGLQFKEIAELSISTYQGDYPQSLVLGGDFNISTHGIFGLAIISSKNIAEALDIASQYSHLIMPAIRFDFKVEGKQASITLEHNANFGVVANHLMEIFMCVIKEFFDQIKDKPKISCIEFSHKNQFPEIHYKNYFGTDVKFNCSSNKITVLASGLDSPMLHSDPYTFELLARQLQQQLDQSNTKNPWSSKVTGYCQSQVNRLAEVSKDEAAEYLHISPRTLTRKLQSEDQNFKKLIDNIIRESAEYFLLNTDISVQEISNKLGYTSQKIFSRTFKRLSGLSPVDFRKSR